MGLIDSYIRIIKKLKAGGTGVKIKSWSGGWYVSYDLNTVASRIAELQAEVARLRGTEDAQFNTKWGL